MSKSSKSQVEPQRRLAVVGFEAATGPNRASLLVESTWDMDMISKYTTRYCKDSEIQTSTTINDNKKYYDTKTTLGHAVHARQTDAHALFHRSRVMSSAQ